LLTICAVNNVPDKQNCIDRTVAKIIPQLNSLSFYQVYVTGSMLDEAKDKKNALIFYQRAYNIYDASKADLYTMTKDQLKQRIDVLNG
jgi:hypothetical protein